MRKLRLVIVSLLMIAFGALLYAQDEEVFQTRKAVYAGSFYANTSYDLTKQLTYLFNHAEEPKSAMQPLAIIAPHAGYIFSGQVAASAYNQVASDADIETVFILAASHKVTFQGASIYNRGHYETPLGLAPVNLELANRLINEHDVFSFQPQAHSKEHSLEVQLPFLQHHMKSDFKIVPIVIGDRSAANAQQIAQALKPYLRANNLFVVSTDFSHYPKYEDALMVDSITVQAVLKNNPADLITTLQENESLEISKLSTSMCGRAPVLALLYMTNNMLGIEWKHIQYMNSGDVPIYGKKERVVGYHALSVIQGDTSQFNLSHKDKEDLLLLARHTLEVYLETGKLYRADTSAYSLNLKTPCGAFVTLYKHKKLRGCIGRFEARQALCQVVQYMVIAAAISDRRFSPVTQDELSSLEIEISVLTPLRKIDSIDDFELGKHGIYIKKGKASGTYLPKVAEGRSWTKEEFIGHCSREKAKIGWEGWKTAELFVYEAIDFGESEF